MTEFVMYFDRDGCPLELLEWARLFEDFNYRYIAQDMIADWRVSTLWFGLNNGWTDYPVGTFETAVFRNGEWMDCYRHNVIGKAVWFHIQTCATISSSLQLCSSFNRQEDHGHVQEGYTDAIR